MMRVLVWEYVPFDDSGEVEQLTWRACSFYEADEGETLCYWKVFIGRSGLFTVDCDDYAMSDGRSFDDDRFIDLQSACNFCEELENCLQRDLERDDFDVVRALKRREERNRKLVADATNP